ncbi:MAG TPA: GyrI-like domain-containing protein [Gaiellaceae bacterium]
MAGEPQVIVEREDVHVMFKRAADEQKAIEGAFRTVESAVGTLRGRKFFGVFDAGQHEYRACVQIRDDDDPEALGLEVGVLPGGRYARVRLEGEPPALYRRIAPSFERLTTRPDHDASRPSIEFYRRHDVVDLLLPVA